MSAGAAPAAILPCTSRLDVWDALFADEDPQRQSEARATAARLCAGCPAPCPEQVTASSAPRLAGELPADWLPPAREGRALDTGQESWHGTPSGVPTYGCRCTRCTAAYEAHLERHQLRAQGQAMRVGASYVPPVDRIRIWAAEAAAYQRRGLTEAEIAAELCVTEETVQRLLACARGASADA